MGQQAWDRAAPTPIVQRRVSSWWETAALPPMLLPPFVQFAKAQAEKMHAQDEATYGGK